MRSLAKELKGKDYLLFTTYKKDGGAVASPMWFALDGETVYMTTRGQSWKVRRLRRDPKVTVGWSDGSGRRHGDLLPARASVVEDPEEAQRARALLYKKYGLKKRLVDFAMRFARDKTEAVIRVVEATHDQKAVEPG